MTFLTSGGYSLLMVIRGFKLLKLKRFTRFRRLRNDEKTALLKAVPILAAAALALRVLGLKRTLELLERVPRGSDRHETSCQALNRETQAVDRAARAMGVGTCLSKSLALNLRLRRLGIDTQVRIGVSDDGELISAHAWLERDGVPIHGDRSDAGAYQAFPPIGAR